MSLSRILLPYPGETECLFDLNFCITLSSLLIRFDFGVVGALAVGIELCKSALSADRMYDSTVSYGVYTEF